MAKFDFKTLGLVMLLSLTLVTIISSMLSNYTSIPVIQTGPSFFLILISVFVTYLYIVVRDGKLDKTELITMVALAIALVGAGYVLKNYFPSIFSILPQSTREVFSAIIGK